MFGCFPFTVLISPVVSVVGYLTANSTLQQPFAHCLFSLSIFPAVDAFPFTAVLRL
ncbi:hypothetical protein B0H10DRAFT_2069236 [Mycena sp. CBHHK59/15]|nr:hypothetical protein B0H10DRAFT_2069236 [Mycena sp. CBHHK59/15]